MRFPIVACVLVAACGDPPHQPPDAARDAPVVPDANRSLTQVALIPVVANTDVDLLFMVDDSPSTLDKQTNLKAAFPALVAQLSARADGLPNVHIGVVTSDLGTSAAGDAQPGPSIGSGPGSCAGQGKNGNLQTYGSVALTGNFISDIRNVDGTRTQNYTGALSTVFSQIASAGSNGCGFEQPLEAVKRALDNNPANAGFLRPSANLGIIVLTDEDDCSLEHASLTTTDTTTLGPLQSFRCTRFGVTCDQGGTTTDEMNLITPKSACHSNESSAYLTRIGDYVTFLRGLKADPRTVLFAALAGDPTPFAVELRTPPGGGTAISALAHSCMYTDSANATEVADPAVRVAELAGGFDRHTFSSVCAQDVSGALRDVGRQIGALIGDPCLTRDIALPASCEVSDQRPGMADVRLPECGGAATSDCYSIAPDSVACPDGQHLRLAVTRATTPSSDTVVAVRCSL